MQWKDIPVMFAQYCTGSRIKTTRISPMYANWKYRTEDGKMMDTISENLQHPLDIVTLLPEIMVPCYQRTLSFIFSVTPGTYTVQYWPDRYAGRREVYLTEYRLLPVNRDSVILPYDDLGYAFRVHAEWMQGEANYDFHLVPVFHALRP